MENVGIQQEESWNKKRLFISFLLIILLAVGVFFLKKYVFVKNDSSINTAVKGISTEDFLSPTPSPSDFQPFSGVQKTVAENLETVKNEITNLNVLNLASSSPQVQKIIQDLQALQQYPHDELKNICNTICGGL